jgi:hypothetical protein
MKSKWLRFRFPKSFASCGEDLLHFQFNDREGKGFSIDTLTKRSIGGMYIEREQKRQVSIDPFGIKEESTITVYYVVKFMFDKESAHIRITNPPRSLKKFSLALHETLGIGFSLADVRINPLDWIKLVEEENFPLLVNQMTISGLAVSNTAHASATLASTKDVRPDLDKFIKGRPFKVDSARVRSLASNSTGFVDYSKFGSIKISGVLSGDIEKISERALEKLTKNHRDFDIV